MRVFETFEELVAVIGEELEPSDWLDLEQSRVDLFAEATDDYQWIHVDAERAAAGPFGGTIAHGYLTLAMIPYFSNQVFALQTPGAKLNYGTNKVRFPHPVRVGQRIRDHVQITGLTDLPTGKQLTMRHTIEIEGEAKPACVAETVVLLLP